MSDRPIFVSSVMDEEMTPSRDAVRAWVRRWGGEPVMWEELAPRDQHPERAYLEGVERSHVFVLMLGHRYGRSDETGYSPTHKEANRASELHVSRLLFQPNGIRTSDRDGRLNDWVASLYAQISGNTYRDVDELTRQLEARLREIAGNQETPWIKLGPIVFPGKVRRQSSGDSTQFIVKTRARDQGVRRVLAELTGWSRNVRADQLTYGVGSWPVDVIDAESDSPTTSEDEVTITCRLAPNRGSTMGAFGGSTFVDQGRSFGPADLAQLWAAQAVFGQRASAARGLGVEAWTAPEGPTLPEVLAAQRAQGWLAEGLIRLYLVEGFTRKFGGHIEHLEVGPATATGVRVEATLRPSGFDPAVATIVGAVPVPA